ncbi:Gfo/Idh/MocA family protein [Jidongwangia harbinensis]|uniref:Gfo/Idh/MocA family protein n=1 Tax=Jidongwangia harbinensis TaxID=2878561 RepID=UPI0027E19042|nr:Gfo/Idh/MocA family oxidoreductase [Jidongwangia harbinensis]
MGAGRISGQYSATLARLPRVAVTAVADLDPARAQQLADQHPGARAMPLPELVRSDEVDLVLNLTTPAQHAEVALAAIAAGKHVYGEKPLAATTADGRAIIAAAEAAGVRVACAPDTVLGTGVQTARAALDAGRIGTPYAASAFMTAPGHELWHPDPEFYYRPGGGPLFDMGPYYLTTLVQLLGPVRRVVGLSSRSRAERTIATGPRAGTVFDVEVDTHVAGVLEHESGVLTTLMMSFEISAARLPYVEVYGSAGSLSLPDPNYFTGPVRICTRAAGDWTVLPVGAGYLDGGRGIGIRDLSDALAEDRPHRAGADLALHILDVMESMVDGAGGGPVVVASQCARPERIDGVIDPI